MNWPKGSVSSCPCERAALPGKVLCCTDRVALRLGALQKLKVHGDRPSDELVEEHRHHKPWAHADKCVSRERRAHRVEHLGELLRTQIVCERRALRVLRHLKHGQRVDRAHIGLKNGLRRLVEGRVVPRLRLGARGFWDLAICFGPPLTDPR